MRKHFSCGIPAALQIDFLVLVGLVPLMAVLPWRLILLFSSFFFQCNANLEHTEYLFLMLNYHRNDCGGDLAIFLAQFTRNPSDVKLFL